MMAPLARAYERAVPERPADVGLFGPRSLVWRVHRDRTFPLAGMRSLMVQALHPLAMAGVAQHSDWRRDPFGRLAATSGYVLSVTYGDTAAANAAAARVRAVHTHVRGTDGVTGLGYSAEDPELLLWVHAGIVDSIVHVVQRYGRGLDAVEADRYVAEMVPFAEIVGVPAEQVPTSVQELREYIESVDLLQATPAAGRRIQCIRAAPARWSAPAPRGPPGSRRKAPSLRRSGPPRPRRGPGRSAERRGRWNRQCRREPTARARDPLRCNRARSRHQYRARACVPRAPEPPQRWRRPCRRK